MAELRLASGHVAVVDEEDWARVVVGRWRACKRGRRWYVEGRMPGNPGKTSLHRVILGAKPGEIVDHINRNSLDNRKVNLRTVTDAENVWNQERVGRPYVGVDFKFGKWRARVQHLGMRHEIGLFDDPETAALARDYVLMQLRPDEGGLTFDPIRLRGFDPFLISSTVRRALGIRTGIHARAAP